LTKQPANTQRQQGNLILADQKDIKDILSGVLGLCNPFKTDTAVAMDTPPSFSKCASRIATITVIASASAKTIAQTTTAEAFHALLTHGASLRSGQNRSKKNPAPKTVATAIPTKML
jgi:hypothetical protein